MEKLRYSVSYSPLCVVSIVWFAEAENPKIIRVFLSGDAAEARKEIKKIFPEAKKGKNRKAELILMAMVSCIKGNAAHLGLDAVQKYASSGFQVAVARAAKRIPCGKVATYRDIARYLKIKSARAVGSALARNPFPILIPCHRVVRSDMTIGGFQAGAGLKKRLLESEGVRFDEKGRIFKEFFI